MAEQQENQPVSEEQRAEWVREQFQKANKFLAENENGNHESKFILQKSPCRK